MRILPELNGKPVKRNVFLRLAALVWIALLSVGMFRMMVYENTPAAVAVAPPSQWPRNSAVPHDPARNILVMLAHPHCPCTRASIAELARVMAACSDKTDAVVLFTVPAGMPPGWEKTDLWTSAAAIPGVRALRDAGGNEAARFGRTSGQCFGFSPSGRRVFSGGITGSRGHEGDNAGEEALISALSETSASPGSIRMPPLRSAPVFGCALTAP